jgi:hypothetical protein
LQKCASYRAKPETAEQQNCGTTTTELTACARASLMVDAAGTRTISHRSNSVGKIVETRKVLATTVLGDSSSIFDGFKMRALFLRSSDLATPSTNSSITTHVLILACRSSTEVARVTTTDSQIRRPASKGANERYPPKKYPFKRRHLQVSTVERFAVPTRISFSRNAPHERRDVLRTSRSRKLHGQPFRFLLQSDQSSVHSVHVHRLWWERQSFQQRRAVREAVWQIQRTRYFVVIGTVAVLIVWGADVCNMPREEGPCKGYFVKYYYEKSVGRCAQFAYGGCGGTGNRFSSNEECESICVTHEEKRSNVTSTGEYLNHRLVFFLLGDGRIKCTNCSLAVCELPVDTGSCQDGYHKRWYFDNARGECIAFLFSGCGGNLNNFKTFQSCVDFCKDYLTVTQPRKFVVSVLVTLHTKRTRCQFGTMLSFIITPTHVAFSRWISGHLLFLCSGGSPRSPVSSTFRRVRHLEVSLRHRGVRRRQPMQQVPVPKPLQQGGLPSELAMCHRYQQKQDHQRRSRFHRGL